MAELQERIDQLERQLREERDKSGQIIDESRSLKEQLLRVHVEPQPVKIQPLYVSSSRKLERFRDRPVKAGDLTIQEWVEDVRSHLATRTMDKPEQAAFIMDHLTGAARQEVRGRGDNISCNPDSILEVLLKVFGDGSSLAKLRKAFFSFEQGEGDLLTTSFHWLACTIGFVVWMQATS